MSYAYWFKAPMQCLSCNSSLPAEQVHLLVSGLNPEWSDETVMLGTVLPIAVGDFNDAFIRLREVPSGADILCLEQWTCPVCNQVQWARLRFKFEASIEHRFAECTNVPLTLEVVRELHYLTDHIVSWLAANPGPETDRIRTFVQPHLP